MKTSLKYCMALTVAALCTQFMGCGETPYSDGLYREYCEKNNGTWNGSECIVKPSAEDECKDSGGTWNGSECIGKPSGRYPPFLWR